MADEEKKVDANSMTLKIKMQDGTGTSFKGASLCAVRPRAGASLCACGRGARFNAAAS